jgi:serine protease Do
MRKILVITALIAAVQPVYAFDKQGLMDAFFSVVMIRGYDAKGGLAYGSGVVVGDNKVITNCHVFRQTKQPWVSRGEESYSITSVKADVWHDLCLVTTHLLPFKGVKIGKSTTLKRGQEVAAIGHSNGVPAPLTSSGGIKALYKADKGMIIRSSAKFAMGASGSGLFDMDGKLVGINTFKTAGHVGSIHFALPIEWLDTLDKQTEISTFPITGKALWEEDEAKKPFYMQVAVPESRADWPKLAEVAEKWKIAEPTNTDAWYALGLANEGMNQPELAEKAFKQSASLDASNFDALVHLGTIAKSRGDTAEMRRIQLALADIDKDLASEFGEMLGCGVAC